MDESFGCGPWLPNRLLSEGGKAILDAPEFYFELELKAIASDYAGPFWASRPNLGVSPEVMTAQVDLAEFEKAVKAGDVKTADPDKAIAAYSLARGDSTVAIPDGLDGPNEFTLYLGGARAYNARQLDEARKIWRSLLALPEDQRRYRSTWAAFMLGKLDLSSDPDTAKAAFVQTRELASQGFRDSLGLAASSLGWEARIELDRGALELAAALYLQQLASGDITAVDSAKVFSGDTASPEELSRYVADGALRRITSAQFLSSYSPGYGVTGPDEPLHQWLMAIEKNPTLVPAEAPRFGWLCYINAQYEDAERWLKKSDPNDPLALWLQAKLLFRAGKLAEAERAQSAAIRGIPVQAHESYNLDFDQMQPHVAAVGDLGLLQIGRAEFLEALRTLLEISNKPGDAGGNRWQDASWLAERVLTTRELAKFIRNLPPETTPVAGDETGGEIRTTERLRWLLARRLVRDGNFTEAMSWLPELHQPTLKQYAELLKTARNSKTNKSERASAFFAAANIARNHGMELMGTENEPDAFVWDGAFDTEDIVKERISGKTVLHNDADDTDKRLPLTLPSTKAERARLKANPVEPEKRFHYRYVAANLGWKAAALMPDQSEETARVLNTAGNWIKNRDPAAADRFLQAIERRCHETPTGQAAMKKHWFVE